jgi:hypothetical protein
MPLADDVEGLQQRYASPHHHCQLAREDRDVLLGDLAATTDPLLLHLDERQPLPAQLGDHDVLAVRAHLAAHRLAALVLAYP